MPLTAAAPQQALLLRLHKPPRFEFSSAWLQSMRSMLAADAGMQQPNGSVVPPRHPKGSMFPPLRTHSELSLGSAVDSPLANATPSQPLDIQGHRSYNLRVGDRPLVRLSLHSPLFGEVCWHTTRFAAVCILIVIGRSLSPMQQLVLPA